jgi:peptidyl-prolyl cis-trans isomerase SurA
MIKLKNVIFIVLLTHFFNTNLYSQTDIFIKYKVEEDIITNIDIENEIKYLIALSPQLKSLDNKKISEIAEASILREKIKINELKKYFNFDEEDPSLENIIKNFYQRLNFKSIDDFNMYLDNMDLDLKDVKNKIDVENKWNILIYKRYNNLVELKENLLVEKIKKTASEKIRISYLLSEIAFEKKQNETLENTSRVIQESINTSGFKNTANLFSISSSAKFGGDIGWISSEKLSSTLVEEISKIKVGEITTPVLMGNFYLILKLEEIKEEKMKIDVDKELKILKEYELNRQLARYSKIYFDKVKKNLNISEL